MMYDVPCNTTMAKEPRSLAQRDERCNPGDAHEGSQRVPCYAMPSPLHFLLFLLCRLHVHVQALSAVQSEARPCAIRAYAISGCSGDRPRDQAGVRKGSIKAQKALVVSFHDECSAV